MDEGSIVEQGSHEELLALRGKYYELWEMQQGNFRVRAEEEEIPLIQNDFIVDENELSYT